MNFFPVSQKPLSTRYFFKLSRLCFAVSLYAFIIPISHAEETVLAPIEVMTTKTSKVPSITISGFGTADLMQIPASITSISSEQINEQQAKVLSDLIKNDAALGDSYAPIGYYQNVVSRGFQLDTASSYAINGLTIRGEQNISLDNKANVEVLKGISAIQSGLVTPGGIVNYVTKRPKNIHEIGLTTDSYGGTGLTTDIGGFFGKQQQFGYRINIAAESIHPYVEHTHATRYFGSAAFDWQINPQSKLELDLESQYLTGRSVPGYQLLDGKVPTEIKWNRLLGYQSWSSPVTTHSLNSTLKYQYQFNDNWTGRLSTAYSRVNIDDYSTFPWGFYDDGTYDIYDYRSPNDNYKSNQFKANLDGDLTTGNIQHHLMFELSQTNKNRHRYQGINEYIGSGNINQDTTDLTPFSGSLGAYYKSYQSHENALSVLDRVTWNPNWITLVGGKFIHYKNTTYNESQTLTNQTNINTFLPQVAVIYSPNLDTHLYASYSKGLTEGKTAPWYTENSGIILSPIHSQQFEVGLKQQIQNYLLTVALFNIKQDNQYSHTLSIGKFTYITEGTQQNRGVELGLTGNLTSQLQLATTLSYTHSRLYDLSDSVYLGHQTQNVPKLRATTQLSYALENIEGLKLLTSAVFSSSKYANKTGTTKVAGYSVFDVGASYQFKPYGYDTQLIFRVDNILNKQYWRDVGEFMGDDYLFLGAPRTAKLALRFNF